MQTFFPYADPRASAAVLDDRRLGKQRVETFQVLRAITWPTYGWKNHPAVRMWRGFVPGLVAYGLACVDEWRARGRADSTRASLLEFTGGVEPDWDTLHDEGRLPPWVGDEALHLSHRSALVRKEPEHYRQHFGDVPDDLPYVWPDPTFPRWPLQRGEGEPFSLAEAATLLGLDDLPTGADDVVRRLGGGEDVRLPAEALPEAKVLGLVAGLCTPGTTLWVVDLPPLAPSGPPPAPRETSGSVSPSAAREPSEQDRLAMAQEAESVPEFRFVRRGRATRALADALAAGLVVTPASADPGAATGRPRLVLPES
ncbi:MSMEG_6728 family protein [Knoellia sp. Soil729]|uniref:MSMEG_6728 family protein n=1 Tax=Knoellia sp. Soil729 TaxID=1736394 RepID=UPI001910C1BB|nr:MSMEG_6728 family protein [Knoellia sp. Soil729]